MTSKKKNPKQVRSAVAAPTIADVAAQARRLTEQAALVDAMAEELQRLFLGEHPARVLQRQGEGARAVDLEALGEVDARLVELAEEYRGQARRLLEMTVAEAGQHRVGTGTAVTVEDVAVEAAVGSSRAARIGSRGLSAL